MPVMTAHQPRFRGRADVTTPSLSLYWQTGGYQPIFLHVCLPCMGSRSHVSTASIETLVPLQEERLVL